LTTSLPKHYQASRSLTSMMCTGPLFEVKDGVAVRPLVRMGVDRADAQVEESIGAKSSKKM